MPWRHAEAQRQCTGMFHVLPSKVLPWIPAICSAQNKMYSVFDGEKKKKLSASMVRSTWLQAAASGGEDSNSAKQQRFLDFFKDLGDQYWGWQVRRLHCNSRPWPNMKMFLQFLCLWPNATSWPWLMPCILLQNESAKRGRGFKGALKENFLPLRTWTLPYHFAGTHPTPYNATAHSMCTSSHMTYIWRGPLNVHHHVMKFMKPIISSLPMLTLKKTWLPERKKHHHAECLRVAGRP